MFRQPQTSFYPRQSTNRLSERTRNDQSFELNQGPTRNSNTMNQKWGNTDRQLSINSKLTAEDLSIYKMQAIEAERRTKRRVNAAVVIQKAFRRYVSKLQRYLIDDHFTCKCNLYLLKFSPTLKFYLIILFSDIFHITLKFFSEINNLFRQMA